MGNLGHNSQVLELLTGRPINPRQLDAADRAEFVREVFAVGNFSEEIKGWQNFEGLPLYYEWPFAHYGGALSAKDPNQERELEWLLIVGCGKATAGGYIQFCIGPCGRIWIGESKTATYGYEPRSFEYYSLDRKAEPLTQLMESVDLFTGTLKGLQKVAAHQLKQAEHQLDTCKLAVETLDSLIGRIKT